MVGSHLIEYYHGKGITPVATYHNPTIDITEVSDYCRYEPCDVRNFQQLYDLLKAARPTIIYHLAAQSYPVISWKKPIETMETNVHGTIHLFESIRLLRESDISYDPMVVVACSSAQYGNSLLAHPEPVTEEVEFLPVHPYGVSKVSQDLLSYQYYATCGIRTIRARIFNTTGTRKINDVVSDFTKRAIQIEKKQESKFTYGNLQSRRAITDVRDLITALVALAEKGIPGEAYNICGSHIYKMEELIQTIESILSVTLPTQQDPSLFRVIDEPIIVGNANKLIQATGWQQQITINQTITDMLNYWRKKL